MFLWIYDFNGDILGYFELHGYNMFSHCRESRQGGEVMVYVNSRYVLCHKS